MIISIIVSLLAGRGLVRELQGLRRSALDLADHRLPEMVDQLATGHDVTMDDDDDSLDVPIHTREIAQVRDAFTKVQRTAVDAAVGQARLREGIGEVFRNLARRSQSLLHRQLALLDRMERRTEDPQELGDLFRLDHLTTRMRAARGEPDHPVRSVTRAWLAEPGPVRGRHPGRRGRGGGLHPGQRHLRRRHGAGRGRRG